ncbi:hypothetical protein ANN_04808 [Periplaneta americana]|uniref:Uncharacterized protein n=1 Tax=Periplaneta americana TaxID=6978 RepID=A0ABQ8T9H5_PERAM|nr:hypothetical protein ANN_04808 [Periplaneta americana]
MAGLCEGGNEPSCSLKAIFKLTRRTWRTWFKDSSTDEICLRELHIPQKATGVAQSVKALACRCEVAFRRGFDPRLG